MLIIDYLGFRLLATSYLPIGKETLLHGSSDGGRTVRTDPAVSKELAVVAQVLHLKPHIVETLAGTQALMHGPADIEVHRSAVDGR